MKSIQYKPSSAVVEADRPRTRIILNSSIIVGLFLMPTYFNFTVLDNPMISSTIFFYHAAGLGYMTWMLNVMLEDEQANGFSGLHPNKNEVGKLRSVWRGFSGKKKEVDLGTFSTNDITKTQNGLVMPKRENDQDPLDSSYDVHQKLIKDKGKVYIEQTVTPHVGYLWDNNMDVVEELLGLATEDSRVTNESIGDNATNPANKFNFSINLPQKAKP